MRSLSDIAFTPLGISLSLAAVLLAAFQIALLRVALRQRRGRVSVLLAVLHLTAGLAFLTVLLDGRYRLDYLPSPREYLPLVTAFYSLPWPVTLALEAAEAAALGLAAAQAYRFARRHPTLQSVKEAVDLLPAGVSVSDGAGEVLLSNRAMNRWSLILTGSPLTDAGPLRERVRELGKAKDGKWLVYLPEGTALQFEEQTLELNGREYLQLTAEDVTEKSRVTRALEEKNARLRELQYRMKAYKVRETELLTRQDLLSARATVHNELGGALLTGKYHLEHPESTDPESLKRMLTQLDLWLLAEAEDPEPHRDALDSALALAEGIGVRVLLTGPIPGEGPLRALLAQAVSECAANTIKHAAGDQITVALSERGFTVTNNGAAPEREIVPTGGLRSLQLAVEQAGGSLALQSLPVFRLTVRLP